VSRYLIRRVGESIVVTVGIVILTFVMIHLEPGSAARAVLGVKATATRIAIFDSANGLNEPLYHQFWTYLDQVFQGNLGTSYSLQEPVTTLISQRLPRDAVLLGISTVPALLIAIPLGIYQAVRRNHLSDYLLTSTTFTLHSIPDFFFATLLIALRSIQFHVFPPVAPQATTAKRGAAHPGWVWIAAPTPRAADLAASCSTASTG
jgi:peptide/nickel transport system permease protein